MKPAHTGTATDRTIDAWLALHTLTDQSLVIRERAWGGGREGCAEGTREPGVNLLRGSSRRAAAIGWRQRLAVVLAEGQGPADVGVALSRCSLARAGTFSRGVPVGFPTM
jgi:hypothetical protein